MTPQQLTDTESEIEALWNAGELNSLTHLCGSTDGSYEQWLCDFFAANVKPGDWVFASHRCHFQYLLHGGKDLIAQVKRGRSMFLFGPRFVCSAIVAGTPPIAAGVALSIQRRGGTEKVWSFLGDGAEDQGAFYEAVRFADGRDLPVTYVVEDNDSQCGVSKATRGVKPWAWPDNVVRVRYTQKFPHAGTKEKMVLKSLAAPK